MKKVLLLSVLVASFFMVGVAFASSSSTQTISLNTGWNIISTPRVVESHEFSVSENSANFDIFILNASSTSGWSTMAEMGQTEFSPLFGYFIKNKTSSTQTLTLNYRENLNPNERLFDRRFTQVGWYSIGVANPTYAKTQYGSITDINNVSNILNSLNGQHSTVIDFTNEDYPSIPWSVRVGNVWKAVVPGDLNSLNDLRETKGYAIYLTGSNALYNGFQNEGNAPTSTPTSTPSLLVAKAPSSPSGNIAPGSQNVVLARYEVKAGGEALEIRKIGLQVFRPNQTVALTGTILVKDATTGANYLSVSADTTGVQQASTTVTAGTLLTYQQNLSSYINLAAGETKVLEVVGTVSQNATSSSNYTVYTGQYYAKRLSSNDYQTLAASAIQANNLTVKSVSVDVTKDASFANTTRSQGASQVKVAQFVLKPSSADDVRITTVNFDITTSSNYQNLKLMDGSVQLGSTIGTPASSGNSFTLSSYVIAKDTPKTLALYADVLSTATTTSVVSIAASGVNGVGVNSSVSLSSTPATAVPLQIISVSTPSLTIATDGTAPTSKIFVAGTIGVDMHKIRFEARNEVLTLKKITLELTTASSTVWLATSTVPNFGTVYLYDGSTLLGSGTFNSTNATVAISGFTLTLPQDTEKVLTVKVDVTNSGTLVPKTVVAIRNYSTSTDDMEVYSNQGILAGNLISVTSLARSNYMLFHDSAPTIANVMSPGQKSPGSNQEIGKFTVTNSAPAGGRSLYVDQLQIVASLSSAIGGTVTTFRLYDDGGTLIATSSAGEVALSSSSTPLTLTFASSSASWVEQAISAGTSRTFTLKADTTNIRSGATSGALVYLSTKIDGTKGYLSTDVAGSDEWFWNDGGLNYHYVQGSTLTGYYGNVASDSYPIDGATLSY